jgi:hypothetical protein
MDVVNYTNDSSNLLNATNFESEAGAIAAADPTRPTYANFGKCYSIPNWVGCLVARYTSGLTETQDLQDYCANVDILSADYYGYTDPYSGVVNGQEEYYGAWTYGADVANVKAICGANKPVLNIVETHEPFSGSSNAITPAEVGYAIWDGVMHGANGIIYFDHDFSGSESDDGLLNADSTTVGPVAKSIDAELTSLAPELNTPSSTGVTVSSTNGIPVTTMLKEYNGHTYLFAMADGNSTYQNSGNTTATITVPGVDNGTATVIDESRTVTASNNVITDSFTPYQVHIYEW